MTRCHPLSALVAPADEVTHNHFGKRSNAWQSLVLTSLLSMIAGQASVLDIRLLAARMWVCLHGTLCADFSPEFDCLAVFGAEFRVEYSCLAVYGADFPVESGWTAVFVDDFLVDGGL